MSGDALDRAHDLAREFLDGVDEARVWPAAGAAELLAALGGPLPEAGSDPADVVEQLAAAARPGLVANAGRGTSASSSAAPSTRRSAPTG